MYPGCKNAEMYLVCWLNRLYVKQIHRYVEVIGALAMLHFILKAYMYCTFICFAIYCSTFKLNVNQNIDFLCCLTLLEIRTKHH